MGEVGLEESGEEIPLFFADSCDVFASDKPHGMMESDKSTRR